LEIEKQNSDVSKSNQQLQDSESNNNNNNENNNENNNDKNKKKEITTNDEVPTDTEREERRLPLSPQELTQSQSLGLIHYLFIIFKKQTNKQTNQTKQPTKQN